MLFMIPHIPEACFFIIILTFFHIVFLSYFQYLQYKLVLFLFFAAVLVLYNRRLTSIPERPEEQQEIKKE